MTVAGSSTDMNVYLNKNEYYWLLHSIYIFFLDRIHGMNDVIGEKPATATSPVPDFNAGDEDR